MAYRNDVDALAARHEALQAEVDEKTRDRDEVSRLLEEARARKRNDDLYQDYASGGPQRRRRRRIRIALGFAALVIGVLGVVLALRVSHHEPYHWDASIKQIQQFKDEMCQCHDYACAQRVVEAMTSWSQQQAREMRMPPPMSKADTERIARTGEQMGQCMQALWNVEHPERPRYPSQTGM